MIRWYEGAKELEDLDGIEWEDGEAAAAEKDEESGQEGKVAAEGRAPWGGGSARWTWDVPTNPSWLPSQLGTVVFPGGFQNPYNQNPYNHNPYCVGILIGFVIFIRNMMLIVV